MSLPRTPSQTVGPYYAIGLSRLPQNELAKRNDPGALRLIGLLFDGEGSPIGDGMDAFPGEAPRFDVLVFARGLLRHELTRVYFADEAPANAADPVFSGLEAAGAASLVAEAEDGALRWDVHMQGDSATVFFTH